MYANYEISICRNSGYGNITPGTNTGRVLTIIYAFIGIPLALLALIALGGLLAKLALALWKFLVRSMGCLSKDLERKVAYFRLQNKTKLYSHLFSLLSARQINFLCVSFMPLPKIYLYIVLLY